MVVVLFPGAALLDFASTLNPINTLNLIFQNVGSADKSPQQSTVLTTRGCIQVKEKFLVYFPKEKQLDMQFCVPGFVHF